jgi:hypothetical protein
MLKLKHALGALVQQTQLRPHWCTGDATNTCPGKKHVIVAATKTRQRGVARVSVLALITVRLERPPVQSA